MRHNVIGVAQTRPRSTINSGHRLPTPSRAAIAAPTIESTQGFDRPATAIRDLAEARNQAQRRCSRAEQILPLCLHLSFTPTPLEVKWRYTCLLTTHRGPSQIRPGRHAHRPISTPRSRHILKRFATRLLPRAGSVALRQDQGGMTSRVVRNC